MDGQMGRQGHAGKEARGLAGGQAGRQAGWQTNRKALLRDCDAKYVFLPNIISFISNSQLSIQGD